MDALWRCAVADVQAPAAREMIDGLVLLLRHANHCNRGLSAAIGTDESLNGSASAA